MLLGTTADTKKYSTCYGERKMSKKENFNYPIYMHVNYLENILPIKEIISRWADAGYDGIELRGYDCAKKMNTGDYLEHVHKLTRKSGIKVTFGCPNDTINPNAGERKKSMDDFKIIIDFASANEIRVLNVFGSSIVNPKLGYFDFHGHGSAYATEEQWKTTIEYFQEAGEFAGARGVDLCFETHNCYIHDLGEPTAKLLSAISRSNVKANLDFGNIYINKLNKGMQEELKQLSGRIGYVHLKNLISFLPYFEIGIFKCTALEDGDINNFVLILKLMKMGYKGVLAIENTMSGDKRNMVSKDLKYLKQLVSDAHSVYDIT